MGSVRGPAENFDNGTEHSLETSICSGLVGVLTESLPPLLMQVGLGMHACMSVEKENTITRHTSEEGQGRASLPCPKYQAIHEDTASYSHRSSGTISLSCC